MRPLAHDGKRPNPAVIAFLEGAGHPGVELAVSARDEMLRHLLRAHLGSIDIGLVGYFRTGLMAARVLRDVLRWRFDRADVRLLELASGYGRVTRFIRDLLPDLRVTVAEIDDGAVAFQRSTLGVSGVVTGADAESLPDRKSDVVFAASFFSHLPEPRFESWLRRLYGLLAPGGVLILSTHGVETLPADRAISADGYYFEEVSESDRFVPAEYGSTWVSEEFVAGLVERASNGTASYRCFRKALWHSQDLYVIVPDKTSDLPSLSLGARAQGYLDTCYLDSPSTLVLAGWAAEVGDRSRLEVRLRVDGELLGTAEPGLPRPDAQALVGAASEGSGFELRALRPQGFSSTDMLTVALESESGTDVLYAGTVEVIGDYLRLVRLATENERLRDERDRARADRDGFRASLAVESARVAELDRAVNQIGWREHVLEQEIAAMRRSRFWRARETWFRIAGRRP